MQPPTNGGTWHGRGQFVVLAGSMVVVRDVVCWQAVAVPLLGLIGIAFSLGACLVVVPYVRRSASASR
jgi:hypothetical protein